MISAKQKMGKRFIVCLGAAVLTAIVMLLLMKVFQVEPFGDCSLAGADCKIQYVDFFNYYKALLSGRNNISYTLTKGLGGNAFGLFSYYLASPFNLLLLFFDGSQVHTVVDLLINIKLALSAATFAYFLQARLYDRLSSLLTILLSVGYSLSYYSYVNGSNLMWLDGMYLLPLMLLGTHRVIRRRSLIPLAVPTAFSILFNWYTGGINCLFCIIWLIFEFFMAELDPETGATVPPSNVWGAGKHGIIGLIQRLLGTILRYGLAMASGVLISAAIFLPTVSVMQQGRGSGFYFDTVKNKMIGNVLDTISQYRIGGTSHYECVCLYCGSLAVIGTFAFFLSRRIRRQSKIIAAGLVAVTLLMYYWQPLYFAFSLFKKVDSYYSRYGYIGSLVLLFLSAMYLQHVFPAPNAAEEERKRNGELQKTECLLPLLCSAIFCVLLLKVGNHPTLETEGVKDTCLFMLGAGTCTTVLLAIRSADNKSIRRFAAGAAAVMLLLITAGELYQSATYVLSYKRYRGIKRYASYVTEAREQVASLKEYDSGLYRISQIGWRDTDKKTNLTAYLNDALAYNYMGIGGYTSSPENDEIYLLDRLGYKQENTTLNVVYTSFIPADSFLGVRYVLSNTDIHGMEKINELGTYNGKETYYNPCALPLAFVYDGETLPRHEYHDPFEYMEEIWTALSGEPANLFTALEAEKTESKNRAEWTLKIPAGNVTLYGNLPTEENCIAMLQAGTANAYGYSQWLSPQLFMIPYKEGDSTVKVTLTSEKTMKLKDEQFYALNLDRLQELADKVRKGEEQVTEFSLENGAMRCTVNAHKGQKLFLILPRSTGWHTTLNGKNIETEEFAYCLTVIPLEEGENRIERVFRAPGLRRGIVLSAAGVLLLALYEIVVVRRNRK